MADTAKNQNAPVMITENRLLKVLNKTRKGLETFINEEGFPKPTRLGSRKYYLVADVNYWIANRFNNYDLGGVKNVY